MLRIIQQLMSIRVAILFDAVDLLSSRTSTSLRLMKCKNLGGGVGVVGVCRRLLGRLSQTLPPPASSSLTIGQLNFAATFKCALGVQMNAYYNLVGI